MRRYFEIYGIMLRNSLIREMSFKANFILWLLVELLWFLGQIVFFGIIFGQVDHIGDWSKWEVVLLVGTHQIIAQLFQAFFFVNLSNVPELVRTGKLIIRAVIGLRSFRRKSWRSASCEMWSTECPKSTCPLPVLRPEARLVTWFGPDC